MRRYIRVFERDPYFNGAVFLVRFSFIVSKMCLIACSIWGCANPKPGTRDTILETIIGSAALTVSFDNPTY